MQRTRYTCHTPQRLRRQKPAEIPSLTLNVDELEVLLDLVESMRAQAARLGHGILCEVLKLEADSFQRLAR